MGVFLQKDNISMQQDFRFFKYKRNFIIITHVSDENRLVYIKKGDTLVNVKNELYVINEKQKLVFDKKD